MARSVLVPGRQPLAGGRQGGGDLFAIHLGGDFAAIVFGGVRTHQRGQVEPFVRLDVIDHAALASRIQKAQLAQILARRVHFDRVVNLRRFHVSESHFSLPIVGGGPDFPSVSPPHPTMHPMPFHWPVVHDQNAHDV